MVSHTYPPGETIMLRGGRQTDVCMLATGFVSVYMDVQLADAGDITGDWSNVEGRHG
jgi:hypothetical protein